MPLYGDTLLAAFSDLKNSINRQNNNNLEPPKGFGINFFGSHHTLIFLNLF
jgi:hypothetical protein